MAYSSIQDASSVMVTSLITHAVIVSVPLDNRRGAG